MPMVTARLQGNEMPAVRATLDSLATLGSM